MGDALKLHTVENSCNEKNGNKSLEKIKERF